jgi:hypothetical protein
LFTLERADVSRGIEFEMTEVGIFWGNLPLSFRNNVFSTI